MVIGRWDGQEATGSSEEVGEAQWCPVLRDFLVLIQ